MTSLDELPQLWNVVRGEMSLVGPRPLLMEYLPHYTAEQNLRHTVLPGIAGWAQVNGRTLTTFSERLKLDLWYVDHWSLWLGQPIRRLAGDDAGASNYSRDYDHDQRGLEPARANPAQL
jgi:lipopolysaccharide/colanic/teichoic acid biosynthesis glycosyltransferase